MLSHAQNFEDIILWRALGNIENGFYIDIGAQHPEIDSVSKVFYDKGWSGINVEPTKECAELLKENRPRDITIQAAINSNKNPIILYEIKKSGLSTTNKEVADRHIRNGYEVIEQITKSVIMDELLAQAGSKEVHWLKIDVEGAEKNSLEGWSNTKNKPWILIIESTYPNTQIQTHEEWENLILEKGYKFAYFDGLNRFYVSNQHLDFMTHFSSGPNVFDAINHGFKISKTSLFYPDEQ